MTGKSLREIAKELARGCNMEYFRMTRDPDGFNAAVEDAILAGMRAALAEPSEEMITAAIRDKTPVNVDSFLNTRHKLCESVFEAMATVRRRELS